jgi:hypothetical protein
MASDIQIQPVLKKTDLNLPPAGGQIEVEIMPGVFAPRDCEETWRAIKAGNVEIVVCICCRTCSAADAGMPCPERQSPVGNRYRERPASGQHKNRGVGLVYSVCQQPRNDKTSGHFKNISNT